ncbi:MAG: hypothetical protein BMS9Abin28_2056 [Anaerolineae bacterium]|nr:MAG: hypothetical protein BMS9Abin28_2056 [Anaerolineae bacterium]
MRRAASTALLLLLAACGSEAQPGLPEPPKIETLAELQAALIEAGALVSAAPNASAPNLGVDSQRLLVGSAPVQVYEYRSVVERRSVSDTIRAGGYLVGGEPVDWPARPNIWATGQLIVVYPGVDGGTVLLLSGLLGDSLTLAAPVVDEPYPPAVLAAIGAAAAQTGVGPEQVQVLDYQTREWPDGCLGLPAPDEMCTEAIVPGWIVSLSAGGDPVVFRVDESGAELRRE